MVVLRHSEAEKLWLYAYYQLGFPQGLKQSEI